MKSKNKAKILVLMSFWNAYFETRLFKLVELLRQNYRVKFCVLTDEMRRRKEIYLAGVPKERLSMPHFRDMEAYPINSLRELSWQIFNANLMVMSTIKGLRHMDKLFKIFNIPTIQINDTPEFSSYFYNPDVLVLPSEAYKTNTLYNHADIAEDKIFIAGDIRFDTVLKKVSDEQRWDFYSEYKLDKNKGFAIFCPGVPRRIDAWARELYLRILTCLNDSGYQVIIRVHPEEWTAHRRPRGMTTMSNEVLYPQIPVIKPWDIDTAMKLCSFVVTVDSSIALEVSNYRKNVIVVNLHESALTDEGRKRRIFSENRYDGCGLKTLYRDANNQPIQSEYLRKSTSQYMVEGGRVTEFSWLGADCHINELPSVLRSKEILQINEDAFTRHIEKFWFKRDGNASLRIAQFIERMIDNDKYRHRIFMSRPEKILRAIRYFLSFYGGLEKHRRT